MKSILNLAAVAVLTVSSSLALAQNVAVVNGKPVPSSRVTMLADQLAKAGRPVNDEVKAQIKEEVILREIFMQEANKRGLAASPDFKAQMELARQSILIRELFNDFNKKNPVTDAEVKAEYDKFVAANGGKEYKASHILVEKEDEAKAILADLAKGAKFEDLAKKMSKDPGSAAKGGDLDWATPNSYVPEFSNAMVKLGKGETSAEPVKSQFGYHIIRVDDVRDAKLPTLAELAPQIKQQLAQQKLNQFQENLRKAAVVQ
jgi:peptidyl-prolyl cis-trans isomerase C